MRSGLRREELQRARHWASLRPVRRVAWPALPQAEWLAALVPLAAVRYAQVAAPSSRARLSSPVSAGARSAGGAGGGGGGGGGAAGCGGGGGGACRGGGAGGAGRAAGGAAFGGCLGFPSGPSSSFCATTTGADCACDGVVMVSCMAVKAFLPSSSILRCVICFGSCGKSEGREGW